MILYHLFTRTSNSFFFDKPEWVKTAKRKFEKS